MQQLLLLLHLKLQQEQLNVAKDGATVHLKSLNDPTDLKDFAGVTHLKLHAQEAL